MNQLQDEIGRYQKMATDDPTNELGHYRLGKALMDDQQHDAAVKSFRRALEIEPQFAKVYELLGTCLAKLNRREEATILLTEGYKVADEAGANVPRDAMAKLLTELGAPLPETKRPAAGAAIGDGFHCQRPGCVAGPRARQLARPPISDELGKRIHDSICAECWDVWLRNLSIKVINENRLDLSTDQGQATYDQIMLDWLGFYDR
jgi:Fe-S cluster biosynthesis and repair protein YggX